MSEKIQIEIKFNPDNTEHPFGLPNRIEVPRGSRIEWVIKDHLVLEEIFFSKSAFHRGMKFTIYFENQSAFDWKSESLQILGPLFYYPENIPIQIASGIAANPGDYKYGLKLSSYEKDENDDTEYDDDPYITVY